MTIPLWINAGQRVETISTIHSIDYWEPYPKYHAVLKRQSDSVIGFPQ